MGRKFIFLVLAVILLFACTFANSTPTTVSVASETPRPTEKATSLPVSPSLRNYAELKGIRFGTYFPWQGFYDPEWKQIAAQEFDLAVIFNGFVWRDIEPEQGQFDFAFADEQVTFALANNMEVCVHTLLWPSYNEVYPAWVLSGNFSREALSQILQDYVVQVMTHYQGKIACWIVVEDPYADSPDRSWDLLYQTFGGYDYIDLVYQTARQTDPQAMLIYNDGENITPDGARTELTRQIIQRLQQKGLIDGVGLEMHLDASQAPDKTEVIAAMQNYGLPVHVTEIDVDLENVPGTQEERYALQARVYGDMLSACLESGVCQSFSVWGFGDEYSFLERYNDQADATLYDDNLDPKPAYFTLLDILYP